MINSGTNKQTNETDKGAPKQTHLGKIYNKSGIIGEKPDSSNKSCSYNYTQINYSQSKT